VPAKKTLEEEPSRQRKEPMQRPVLHQRKEVGLVDVSELFIQQVFVEPLLIK
jgi:hypothetical protein